MLKAWFVLFLLLPSFAPAQQGTPVTLSFSADGVATATGANYTFTLSGTASLTGLGSAGFYASGNTTLSSIGTTGAVTGDFAMLFTSGDSLTGQVTIPAGYLLPSLGQSLNVAASVTVTGGAGTFTGASGSFPITGAGSPTGALSAHLTASGSGTLRLPAVHVAGTLAYAGSMAHLAAGGGWKTSIILLNNGSKPAQAQVSFFDENGNPLILPLTSPQAVITTPNATSVTQTIQAGGELVIESVGTGDALSLGSAQLFTDGSVSGFIIFRYNPSGQEAAVPLQAQNAASYSLAFDNTTGLATGVAVANVSSQPANIQAIVRDDTGAVLAMDTIHLPGSGHLSFVVADRYLTSAQHRGTIELQTPANGQISALAIRSTPSGVYTTIPAVTK
jgi:hypothetical protein